jgi:hypothetical protein
MREETPLRKTAKAAHKQYGRSDKLEISEYCVVLSPMKPCLKDQNDYS